MKTDKILFYCLIFMTIIFIFVNSFNEAIIKEHKEHISHLQLENAELKGNVRQTEKILQMKMLGCSGAIK